MSEKVNISRQTFTKSERLCSTKLISALFESGSIFHTSLFKVVWAYSPSTLPFPAQVAFSVSKRSFKHAVSRNLARRRMREAYRKHKSLLYHHLETLDTHIIFTVILKGSIIPDYASADNGISGIISRLIKITDSAQAKC